MSERVFQDVLEQPDNRQQQLFRPDQTIEGVNLPNVPEFFFIM